MEEDNSTQAQPEGAADETTSKIYSMIDNLEGLSKASESPQEASKLEEAPGGAQVDKAPEKPAEPLKEAPKVEITSPAFAALAKKEKALREREAKFAESQKEHEASLQLVERLKTNPSAVFEMMEKFGYKLADIVNSSDEYFNPSESKKALREVESLRAELAAQKQKEVESKNESEIQNAKGYLADYLKQNMEKYELVAAEGSVEDVWQVMNQVYESQGRILSEDEAFTLVENALEERTKSHLDKLRASKKLSGLFSPATATTNVAPKKIDEQPANASPLSNASTNAIPSRGDNEINEEQRMKKIYALLDGI